MKKCLDAILSHSSPSLATPNSACSFFEKDQEEIEKHDESQRIFMVTKIKDNFSEEPEYGLRSVCLNLEMAWDGSAGSRWKFTKFTLQLI